MEQGVSLMVQRGLADISFGLSHFRKVSDVFVLGCGFLQDF
jgi:hypothetical protein